MDNVQGNRLEDGFARTRETLENLKTLRLRQTQELTRLSEQSKELERKLNRRENETEPSQEKELLSASPTFGYGAKMIGRTVLEASLYCNRLTGDGTNSSAKELVNLILGKTEMIKAEMFNIILSDKQPEEKRTAIDAQFEQAKDYFESIMYQTK